MAKGHATSWFSPAQKYSLETLRSIFCLTIITLCCKQSYYVQCFSCTHDSLVKKGKISIGRRLAVLDTIRGWGLHLSNQISEAGWCGLKYTGSIIKLNWVLISDLQITSYVTLSKVFILTGPTCSAVREHDSNYLKHFCEN